MSPTNTNVVYQGYGDTLDVLEESQQEREPYTTTILGEEIVVYPNVYSPKYFTDTKRFAKHLPVKKGDVMLEIGSGTGAVTILAAKRGAKKVVAIDINPDAVQNTRHNARKHHLEDRIDVRHGDVYEPLRGDEKFDVIFWNTPFGLIDGELSDLEKAVSDSGYRATERFIKEAKSHLRVDGRLYIGFSSTLGRLDLLKKFAYAANFVLRTIYEVELGGAHLYRLEIFEAMASNKNPG